MLRKHVGERLAGDGAGVAQRVGNTVTEFALKTSDCELLTPLRPVERGPLGRRQHPAALIFHEFVVCPPKTPFPRGVALERLTGKPVVIDLVHVVVRMASGRVNMRRNEVICRVQPLRQLHPQLVNASNIVGAVHVELVRRKVLRVRVQLDLAAVSLRQRLGTGDEILGRPDRAAELRGPVRTVREVLGTLRIPTAVEGVSHRVRGRLRRSDVTRAHDSCTLSPSRDRTSSTAPRTAPRRRSSTAPPRRRTWFKFTPTRRSCSTAAASSGLGAMAAAASIASTCPPLESRASSTVARTHAEGAVPRRSARRRIASRSAAVSLTSSRAARFAGGESVPARSTPWTW